MDRPDRDRVHVQGSLRTADADVGELTLLIVDDCCLYREGLATMVVRDRAASTVRTAWDAGTLRAALDVGTPDVILLNLATHASSALLAAARERSPDSRLIVLGVSEAAEEEIIAMAEAGVAGYLMRSEPLAQLLRLIRSVAAGETLCSPRVTAVLLRRLSAAPAVPEQGPVLTDREDQILELLALGLSNKQIAERLCIEVRTVKNHVHNILSKLGVRSRVDAAALRRPRPRRAI